jgi:NAD(P)-dependent dehydrogenase (short-subunit alcohol dehydrogenase family)
MDPRDVVDDLLEVTVVGSFSSIGYDVRSRMYGWQAPPPDALVGKTVLITGPTSGLGRTATDRLAALGARVVLVGRSEERLAEVRDALVAAHGDDRFPIVVADMASLESVRRAVDEVRASERRLDVLIDNAGAIFPERTTSPDGIEATLATMVVGPFVLESGLLPILRRTAGARVIAVTSGGQYAQGLDLDDLQSTSEPFSGTRAYARAKRAQVALIREWDRRLGRTGPAFDAMHPGWADTPGLAASLPGFTSVMGPILRTAAEGVDTLIWLAAAGAGEVGDRHGRLLLDRRVRPFDRIPSTRLDRVDRRRLWDLVVELSGSTDPAPE